MIGIGWWFADKIDESTGILKRFDWASVECLLTALVAFFVWRRLRRAKPIHGTLRGRFRCGLQGPDCVSYRTGGVQLIHDLIALLRDPGPIIQWGGYPALALIIFLETGAMVAFLPGDSLLFVAGLYACQGRSQHRGAEVLLATMAIAATPLRTPSVSKVGPRIFNRPNSRLA